MPVDGISQSIRRDLWPFRHLIRAMRQYEPWVFGGQNASWVLGCMDYGGSNARNVFFQTVFLQSVQLLHLQSVAHFFYMGNPSTIGDQQHQNIIDILIIIIVSISLIIAINMIRITPRSSIVIITNIFIFCCCGWVCELRVIFLLSFPHQLPLRRSTASKSSSSPLGHGRPSASRA